MQVLITGSAGFIGYHLAKALARQGIATYGIDSINSYYDVSLKKARLKACGIDLSRQEQEYRSTLYPNYTFRQMDLCDKPALDALFASRTFDTVINLAAQAGVRYSLEHPETYIDSNVGFSAYIGRLPPPSYSPSDFRFFVIGIWQFDRSTVPRRCAGRSSGQYLRRHQKE